MAVFWSTSSRDGTNIQIDGGRQCTRTSLVRRSLGHAIRKWSGRKRIGARSSPRSFPVGQPASLQGCAFQPFTEPLNIPPIKQPVASLSPAPTAAPNTGAGEGRTITHQAFNLFPPVKLF